MVQKAKVLQSRRHYKKLFTYRLVLAERQHQQDKDNEKTQEAITKGAEK